MTKDYTASHHLYESTRGSIRKAAFDQRKSDYLRNTYDRPAVFIKASKNNYHVRQNKS